MSFNEINIIQGFDELAEQNNLNGEEKAFISQKAGKLAHLLKAPKCITAIADDISNHYQTTQRVFHVAL
jgi:type I restriction enzyme R subunit